MKKYEYMTWDVASNDIKYKEQLITALNLYGNLGWLVVAYDDGHYMLAREVVEPQVAQSVDA